jgi:outer membrane protein OmpA-like peptidoglycan-associated protein
MKKLSMLSPVVVLLVALVVPVTAQEGSAAQITSGAKMKMSGIILKQEDQGFKMRDQAGSEWNVRLASNAKIEERKKNPFRGSKKFTQAQLVRGLYVEVEGHGGSGSLTADKIKFSEDALQVANSVNSTVVPVENRLGEAETRVTATEENAKRLSGQIDELSEVANIAKGGAAAAQETADVAVEGVNRTNDRISSLDDYDVKKSDTITFRVGSWMLSREAKAKLDEIATEAKAEKGFIIEVRGFASSDGSENSNRVLSQKRAETVMHYLADQGIPLRRIVLPFGYGTAMPVADNSTRNGRQQNRRAEVSILVSKGLTSPVNVNRVLKEQ